MKSRAFINIRPRDFRNRRERDDLKPGVLKNVLLLVTDEARLSCGTAGECSQIFWGYLWAIDPDWPLSEVDEDGYDGRLKIHITSFSSGSTSSCLWNSRSKISGWIFIMSSLTTYTRALT
jgi:hypothetical protein